MKVRVQFFAQLRDLSDAPELTLEVPSGTRVQDLLEIIYKSKPQLRSHDRSLLIGVGVEFVDRTYTVQEGDEVAIMPPVQGG